MMCQASRHIIYILRLFTHITPFNGQQFCPMSVCPCVVVFLSLALYLLLVCSLSLSLSISLSLVFSFSRCLVVSLCHSLPARCLYITHIRLECSLIRSYSGNCDIKWNSFNTRYCLSSPTNSTTIKPRIWCETMHIQP